MPLARARTLEPDKASIREALGRALFHSQRYREAAEEFGALAAASPTDDYAQFCLGRALQQLGRHREACGPLAIAACLRPERSRVPGLSRPRAGGCRPRLRLPLSARSCAVGSGVDRKRAGVSGAAAVLGAGAVGVTLAIVRRRLRRVAPIRLLIEPYRNDRADPDALAATFTALHALLGPRRTLALEVHLDRRAGGRAAAWFALLCPAGSNARSRRRCARSYPNVRLRVRCAPA